MAEDKAQITDDQMDSECTGSHSGSKCKNDAENDSSDASVDSSEDTVASNSEKILSKKAEELETQLAALKDAFLRKLAESDNLRKRLEKEKTDAAKYANGKFAKDLLSVIDNLDRVINHVNDLKNKVKEDTVLNPFLDGVDLCRKELLSVFKKHGINKINVSVGTRFDPNFHEAMCEVVSKDHEAGSVVDVMQSGYTYNDRLLRPAMVSVAKSE